MQNQYKVETAEQASIRKKNRLFQKALMSVGAGLAGSVLTLAAAADASFFGEQTAVHQVSASTSSLADMVEAASKAVVGIINYKEKNNPFMMAEGGGTGSGFIFKKAGGHAYIATNNHVIAGAYTIEVSLENGEKTSAELVGADPLTDLAVLKIDAAHVEHVLKFGDSEAVRAGDQVVAIGNPLGLDFSRTVTQGIVSAVNRTIRTSTAAGPWDLDVIQTDAAINPGNSGGALLNMSGEVIGINSLKVSQRGVEGLGFAIPSNDAVPLIEEMMKKGKVERPYIGVNLVDLGQIPHQYVADLPAEVKGGAMVAGVAAESSAAKAGLQVQDIIVAIEGNEIENTSDLRKQLYKNYEAGDTIQLKVYRNGQQQTIKMTLMEGN